MQTPAARNSPALAVVALAALYALTHPFTGFSGDSQIYLGRALADLDPGGVGRDLMFRLDNQSRFTIFPQIASWLAAHVSLLATALVLVALSSALWFGALVALVRQAAPSRIWACVALVILAPAGYGGFDLLRVAEPLAIPRPFAEAFTLAAVAAFLARRLWLACALLVAAALFHPLMALAGFATLGLALSLEDRRWLYAACAAAGVALAAMVALVFGGKLPPIDAEWLQALTDRNAYLFPHLWPTTAWGLPAVQALTLVLAAAQAEGRLRNLLLASLVAGAAGLAVAWVFGAYEPAALFLQAQFWRMWWLPVVLSALALALCAIRLGQGAATDRLALALLTLAWLLPREFSLLAVLAAAAALAISLPVVRAQLTLSGSVVRLIWIGVAGAALAPSLMDLADVGYFAGMFQPDYRPSFMPLVLKLVGPPLLFAAVAVSAFGALERLAQLPQAARAIGALAIAGCAAAFWNDASSYDRALGTAWRQPMPTTEPAREVLWLSASLEPWAFLAHPSWSSEMQGAGGVFSRDLALKYRDRARAQVDAGLRDASLVRRGAGRKTVFPDIGPAAVRAICARPDAPAAIFAPVRNDAAVDPTLQAHIWTPPAVRVEMLLADNRIEFPRIERYAVIECSK